MSTALSICLGSSSVVSESVFVVQEVTLHGWRCKLLLVLLKHHGLLLLWVYGFRVSLLLLDIIVLVLSSRLLVRVLLIGAFRKFVQVVVVLCWLRLLLLEHHQLLLLFQESLKLLFVELVEEFLTENRHLHQVVWHVLILHQHLVHLSLITANLELLLQNLILFGFGGLGASNAASDLLVLGKLLFGEIGRSRCNHLLLECLPLAERSILRLRCSSCIGHTETSEHLTLRHHHAVGISHSWSESLSLHLVARSGAYHEVVDP